MLAAFATSVLEANRVSILTTPELVIFTDGNVLAAGETDLNTVPS
jgi:hypothetical protein